MKNSSISAALAVLVLTSCNSKPSTDNANIQPAAPVEKTAVVVDPPKNDGTSIKVNNDGVSIESNDGSRKNSVKVVGDSASIEITRSK